MSALGWAVLTAVCIAAAVGIYKGIFGPIGRWLTKHLKETFAEVVTESVADKFAGLGERFEHLEVKFDAVQEQNSADHNAVVDELGQVKERLTSVETRLSAVEALLPKEPVHVTAHIDIAKEATS